LSSGLALYADHHRDSESGGEEPATLGSTLAPAKQMMYVAVPPLRFVFNLLRYLSSHGHTDGCEAVLQVVRGTAAAASASVAHRVVFVVRIVRNWHAPLWFHQEQDASTHRWSFESIAVAVDRDIGVGGTGSRRRPDVATSVCQR
jgi:hypothetical protein